MLSTSKIRIAERRILRDLLFSAAAIILFACAAYFLKLQDALAEWASEPAFKLVSTTVLVSIYAIWLLGIFLLRRLYDLRRVLSQSAALEKEIQRSVMLAAVGRTVAGIAHDFGNIMMIIHGMVELCLKDQGEVRSHLGDVKDAAEKGIRLAAQLTRLGRSESPETDRLDLNEIVSDLSKMISHLAGEGVRVGTTLSDQELVITCNRSQVEEVIVNLVTNAGQAMTDGGELVITTDRVALDGEKRDVPGLEPGDYAKISISDTGGGIDPSIEARIFEPYVTGREDGTGLGLAMVYAIVKQCYGTVTVDSEPGHGTTFTMYFPLTV